MPNSGAEACEPAYSWCIAFACFWLSFLTVGLHRSAGIIYVSVVQVFDITREQAIWPFSLCGSLMCLLGPLAGFLTHYFRIRSILLCGILIAAAATAACFFTPNLLYLVIFFGALRGIGNGLVVTLNPVLINQHFKKRKATATGIAYAGASVGSFALPPLIEYLLSAYGFKGCFLLLAAVILNGLIPAFLSREPPPTASKPAPGIYINQESTSKDQTFNDLNAPSKNINGVSPDQAEEPLLLPNQHALSHPEVLKQESVSTPSVNGSARDDPMVWYNNEINSKHKIQSNGHSAKEYKLLTLLPNSECPELPTVQTSSVATGPLSFIKKMQQTDEGVFGHFRHTAQILTNPMYLVICFTFGCNVVNFLSFLTVIVDFALDRGISESDAVFLVSAFSVGDLFGAVCLGWISDMMFLQRRYTVTSAFLVMGVLLIILPVCWTHALMLTVSILMGILNGCVMTNMPVIMRDYLGLERLAVAVGLGHFMVGVGQLLFPLLIGYFRDDVGSYDYLFYTLGVMCVLCSFLWLLEPLLRRFAKK